MLMEMLVMMTTTNDDALVRLSRRDINRWRQLKAYGEQVDPQLETALRYAWVGWVSERSRLYVFWYQSQGTV